jgi:hypothetical protein
MPSALSSLCESPDWTETSDDRVSEQDAIHSYETDMLDYGSRAVHSSLRAMEQAIPKSATRLFVSRAFFHIVDRVPLLKRLMFRGMGDD